MKAVKTQERLFEEFIDFQKMPKTEIPQFVWIEASVQEPSDDEDINYCRMDRIWAYLGSMRDSLTGHLRFERLARVAKLVLTLPHSNADEERGFSFIKMNKTPVRNALKLNETTLSSLLTIKMAINLNHHRML